MYAEWAGRCQSVLPLMKRLKLEKNYEPSCFVMLHCMAESHELLEEFRGKSMPHFLFFRNGVKKATVAGANMPAIEKYIAGQVAKKGQGMYNRIEVTKDQALEMFGYNKFKVEMINELMAAGTTTTVYRVGDFVDLCRGPHIPKSNAIMAMMCTKLGAAYWRGDAANDSLQRVYGISFPDKKQLAVWKMRMEEAKKRDHRVLGVKQSLFFFNAK